MLFRSDHSVGSSKIFVISGNEIIRITGLQKGKLYQCSMEELDHGNVMISEMIPSVPGMIWSPQARIAVSSFVGQINTAGITTQTAMFSFVLDFQSEISEWEDPITGAIKTDHTSMRISVQCEMV